MEEELPDVGFVYFEDVETGEVVAFDTSRSGAQALRGGASSARATSARRCSAGTDMDFVNVRTDAPYVAALIAFFARASEDAPQALTATAMRLIANRARAGG